MIIGVDFDNTIVRYDNIFHTVAREQGLIPEDLPVSKSEVRNYLRRADQEDLWTEMQGYVYGKRMVEAEGFEGVKDFFRACKAKGIETRIISHKTRHPYAGEQYDLHAAARAWLTKNRFFDPDDIALPEDRAFFELTKEEKIARVASEGCDWFIDDLPEILTYPDFPTSTQACLFDPDNRYDDDAQWTRACSWQAISDRLL